MTSSVARRRLRALALAAVAGVVAAGGVGRADARPSSAPTVELGSAAWLAPNGQSVRLSVIASCAERWSVVEARVTVSQAQATGSGTFPLTCIGSKRVFSVTVQSSGGRFQLGSAQAAASVVVQRGRTERAQDSATLRLDPAVDVSLGDSAVLHDARQALSIAVTASCPPGPTGEESFVAVSQGNVVGRGSYVPFCDGEPHTFDVTVSASAGAFQPGDARALTFAGVSFGGMSFTGVADEPVQLVS